VTAGGSTGVKHPLLRFVLRPGVLIPVALAIALLIFALSLTNVSKVFARVRSLDVPTLAVSSALALVYLCVKVGELKLLLAGLGFRPHWRKLLLAFTVAEMTITIPSGVYIQNYVLKRVEGTGFARSAAATSAMLALEAATVLAVLAALPIPGWTWVRLVSAAVMVGGTALLFLAARSTRLRGLGGRLESGRLAVLVRGLRDLLLGLRSLARPRLLLPSALLTISYLSALLGVFLFVAHGIGIPRLTFVQATTIYLFSLGVTLSMAGALTQLGVLEVAGIAAAHAWGYTLTDGLAMLLAFRIVWMGSIWLICGPVALALRAELRRSPGNNGEEAAD
jgi:hypothetical protein